MIDCGDLHDINAAMGLELDMPAARDPAILRQYRCAALTGILASGQQHSPIGAAELACAFADLMMEREG